jgi:hypothetical protein
MRSQRENARSTVVAPKFPSRASFALLPIALLAIWPATAAFGQSASPAPAPAQSQSQTPAETQTPPPSKASSQPASQPSSQSTLQTVPGEKQQSLADAAREANAQKNKPKAKRVYTGDDLGDIHGNISVVGDGSAGGSADHEDSSKGRASAQGNNGEAYWRSRARSIKDQIASTDQQIASVKAEIAKSGAASFDPSTGLSQGVIIVHDRNAQVKQLEDRKASLERQLDDLADDARKAGADSGWVR